MVIEYSIIAVLVFVIFIMALMLYRYSKVSSQKNTLPLENLKEEFDTSYFTIIDSIVNQDNEYEVAEVLLKEIQRLTEKCQILELEIYEHKKSHSKLSEGLERKTHEIIHISHQMRTSLSGLLGFTQFLKSTTLTEEQEEFVSIISTSSDELLALVNNIIDMTPKPRLEIENIEIIEDESKIQVKNETPFVLVVDDNEINKRLLAKVLENEELEVIYASNGEEAVRLRKEHNFDVIFMDIQMPVMDGVEASKAIRKYEDEEDISPVPIIALTANTGKDDRDTYLDAGMTDYMAKPIMIEDIRKKIAQL